MLPLPWSRGCTDTPETQETHVVLLITQRPPTHRRRGTSPRGPPETDENHWRSQQQVMLHAPHVNQGFP
jgi:hypothetical protein